jgi:hypothetical protein
VLADLVAARRPTVTSSLTELTRRGVVRPSGPGWLLAGDPPGELLELDGVTLDNGSSSSVRPPYAVRAGVPLSERRA